MSPFEENIRADQDEKTKQLIVSIIRKVMEKNFLGHLEEKLISAIQQTPTYYRGE